MKKLSDGLYQFLKERNVLNGTESELKRAKREYRAQYLKNWQKERKIKYKDIRIRFNQDQYKEISNRAKAFGLCNTHYVKQIILHEQENFELIPNREELQLILQKIAMANIQCIRNGNVELSELLDTAENLLTKYLLLNT